MYSNKIKRCKGSEKFPDCILSCILNVLKPLVNKYKGKLRLLFERPDNIP